MARISYLECTRCGKQIDAAEPRAVCPECDGFLLVRYDLQALRKRISRSPLPNRPASMWRYADVLPDSEPVTLGEGFTPLLHSRENPRLLIKDESMNPIGTTHARWSSMVLSMARTYGLKELTLPAVAEESVAFSAYAAKAGIVSKFLLPKGEGVKCGGRKGEGAPHLPGFGRCGPALSQAQIAECEAYGAQFVQAGASAHEQGSVLSAFRLEGQKTLGYEIAEQMNWTLPDAIVCPTGTNPIAIWKAFDEMRQLGWLFEEAKLPRMIAVNVADTAAAPESALIQKTLDESNGTGVAVTKGEMLDAMRFWTSQEGLLASPEGASALAAYRKLSAQGVFQAEETVVLLNTGTGLRYLDLLAMRQAKSTQPKARAIGGIIQPY